MDLIAQQALQEHLGIFLLALFLSLITCFIAWYRSYFKLPISDSKQKKMQFGHVLVAFALYFFVSFFISYMVSYWVLGKLSFQAKQKLSLEINAVQAWVNLGAMAFVFISLLIYLKKLKKEVRLEVLGDGAQKLRNFGMGILSWFISFPLIVAISQLANLVLILLHWQSQEQVSVRFFRSTMQNPVVFAITCLFIILVIPLIEEIIFRGFLQNWFSKFLGEKKAILITAIIFSFFHFSAVQKYGNIEIISSLFVLAYFLGFIYFRQKSIYASWGLHAAFNGFNVLMMSLAQGVT